MYLKTKKENKMETIKKIAIFFLVKILPIVFIIVLTIFITNLFKEEEKIDRVLINMDYELGIIKSDLETYNKLSDEVIEKILVALKETALKENLPVGLLHSINRVESEYQYNIVHPTVEVPVGKDKDGKPIFVKTNAVGTGGIMWVYWKDSLRNAKIAQTEMDLFFPDKSIRATGYILRWMINDELRLASKDSNYKLNPSNILRQVVKRYYGAYSEQYLARMQNITSDLWMKRMAFEIFGQKDTVSHFVIINKETMKIN